MHRGGAMLRPCVVSIEVIMIFGKNRSSGGVEWLAYDFTMAGKNFSYAGAMIDGECYFVGCMFNDSNKDTITALYNQARASVRPYSG